MMRKSKKNIDKSQSPKRIVFDNFMAKKTAVVGVIIFALILVIVLIFPIFIKTDINNIDPSKIFNPPSSEHWFGTDELGRDYFARILIGGRVTLLSSFVLTLVTMILAVVLGIVAGYFGGVIDMLIMRSSEIISSIPFLAIAIMISVILREAEMATNLRIVYIMIVIGFISWGGYARLIRANVMSLRESEFMLAAKSLGIKRFNQMFRHLLPNVIGVVIIGTALRFASAILVESGLSFLGLGTQEPDASWGALINNARSFTTISQRWWIWVIPSAFIVLTVFSVNLIGDGLTDAINPKENER
ncbi:MAG: ABC transporter permease [Bacilli bacterium]